MKRSRALWLALLMTTGCGGGSSLSGSLEQIYPLAFDTVRTLRVGDFLVVDYTKTAGDHVAKLSVSLTDGYVVKAGTPIDLTSVVAGNPRGTLTRVTQTTLDLPIKTGTVTFDQVPAAAMPLSGHFAATLSNPDGRTLNGTFSATLEQVQ